jgi:ribosome silencing factor RsfS/YbeB/iojap
MGADILEQLPRWRRWTEIARRMAFVVLPRPLYNNRALAGQAAHRLRATRRPAAEAALLPGAAPGWVFLPAPQNAISATAIRQSAKEDSAITKTPTLAASPARHKPAARKTVAKPKLAEAAAAVPGTLRKKTIAAGPKKPATPRAKKVKTEPSVLDKYQAIIVGSLDDDKAEKIVTIDLAGKAMFCDRMVIATGLADRQISAMAQHLSEKLKEAGLKQIQIEGAGGSDWVLIDTGDIVVHLFKPEARTMYGLEKMWGEDLDEAAEG